MSEASTTMSSTNDRELIAENTRRKEAQRRLKAEVDTLKAQLAERASGADVAGAGSEA